LRLFKI